MSHTEQTYGFFPGGDYDPRKFSPDRESNTPDEIAAWERLCAAWNAGGSSIIPRSGRMVELPSGSVALACGSSLGVGTYEIEVDDDPEPGAEEDIPAMAVG